MIMNQEPYPISFELQHSQALVCRYGEEMRQYIFKPDIDVSGLSCLLQIAKTDGTFTENGVEVHTDPDTGECTLVITIPQQATVVKGLNRYSICVYGEIEGEDHLLYSAEGPLWVDDNLITDDMIASVAEVNGLVFPQDFLTVENLVDIVNYVAAEIIKDDTTSETTTWSSQKISDEIDSHNTPIALDDLTDVSITSPQTGDIIQRNNSGQWVNTTIPGHIYSTSEHIIGTWIDDSPVYEKTIDKHANPVLMYAYTWYVFDTLMEDIKIIDAVGCDVDNGSISSTYPIVANYDSGDISVMHLRNGIQIAMGYITIRYIKTS